MESTSGGELFGTRQQLERELKESFDELDKAEELANDNFQKYEEAESRLEEARAEITELKGELLRLTEKGNKRQRKTIIEPEGELIQEVKM